MNQDKPVRKEIDLFAFARSHRCCLNNDGEIILVTYSGAIAASKEVNDRLNNGEEITSKDEYFITAPQFTTGSKKYEWLNHIQAVGKMVSFQRGIKIKYDWFIVR